MRFTSLFGLTCFSIFVARGRGGGGLDFAGYSFWGVGELSGIDTGCSEMNGLDGDRLVNTFVGNRLS